MAKNTCVGDEPRGDVDIFDANGNWVNAAAKAQGCFMDYLISEWGPVFGWASWTWRYGDPAINPQPGDEPPEEPPEVPPIPGP